MRLKPACGIAPVCGGRRQKGKGRGKGGKLDMGGKGGKGFVKGKDKGKEKGKGKGGLDDDDEEEAYANAIVRGLRPPALLCEPTTFTDGLRQRSVAHRR